MKKRICLIGGEDVHKRIPFSRYLTEAGFHVTIIGTSKQSFPDFITYVPYNLNRSFSPIKDYKTLRWITLFFKTNSFNLVHTFDTKPAFLVPIALKNTKTPITRTITGLGTIFMSNTISSKLLRRLYFKLHKNIKERVYVTIFQNEDDKNIYLTHKLANNKNCNLVYSSGIELLNNRKIAKRNNSKFTFICVARLVYEKGIINLLEASRICKNNGLDFQFWLVGPLEENSAKLNRNILEHYKDVVTVLGQRNDVNDLLLKADAFVLPTFREGFSRVLLEAGAVGLPIISTNVTGVKEFARHESEALLVSPKNSLQLANAMMRLANDKELANKLSKNALKHVEKFSLKNISKQYITIFDKAINQYTP